MKKRYQVFVSSTYEDLREERQKVMHALLRLGCIPAGMELFPAATEDVWRLITGVIDESDYYVLIIAERYGSRASDGMGYTEKEYRYAREKSIPTYGFFYKGPPRPAPVQTRRRLRDAEDLQKFRKHIREKWCDDWQNSDDLVTKVTTALHHAMTDTPRIGWVRADSIRDRTSDTEPAPTGRAEDLAWGEDGGYGAALFTDRRRNKEAERHAKTAFLDTVKKLPDLMGEIKTDLAREPSVREFFVLSRGASLGGSDRPCFIYETTDANCYANKVQILENMEYVIEVTPKNTPMYRMTEEFVELVTRYA